MSARTGSNDLRPLILERRARLGDLLAALDGSEWDRASLCHGWLVRDVVAHCIQNHRAAPWNLPGQMVAAGFRIDVRNQQWVERWRALSPERLLGEYRATMERTAFPAFEARFALTEDVVHGFDIARPLGRVIEVPERALVAAADTYLRTTRILHGRPRCVGLGFVATDHPWTGGSGQEVRGPLASILVAIAGRAAAADDLSGPGVRVLRRRLAEER
ncbi:MAG: maleylpyruvate isomerase family mycothiol-dependent enzyme [Candidatus Dormibacteraeota bacterium]|nr:maleylpyruvate isomerase family mycothiol-dependent enzyme [Candidatus Dormibacteraeota bacterium]